MISIIVPIYKAESFLSRCIESVFAQTYRNWELLLIDDGSPDKSGEICDEYALKDSRIRVFHKSNGGVSSARNPGLDNAEGEWISFLDSDDYLQPSFLEKLTGYYSTAELIISGSKRFGYEDTEYYIPQDKLYSKSEFVNGIFKRDPALNVIFCTISYPWGKILKRDIIIHHQLRFNESMKLSEDTCFMLEYLSHCTNIQMVNGGAYMYFVPGNRIYKMTYAEFLTHKQELCKSVSLVIKGYNQDTTQYVNSLYTLYICALINHLKVADHAEVRSTLTHFGLKDILSLYLVMKNNMSRKRALLNTVCLSGSSMFKLLKNRL